MFVLGTQDLLPQNYSAYYKRTTYTCCERRSLLLQSCSDSISDQPATLEYDLGPYISLAVDICEIKSKIFPNLGLMTHSNISG